MFCARLTVTTTASLLLALAESLGAAPVAVARLTSGVQQPYDLLPSEPPAFDQVTGIEEPRATELPSPVDDFANTPWSETALGCCDPRSPGRECCPGEVAGRGWTIVLEASALQSHMAARDVDDWPDDYGAAGRISLGYETEGGLGVRAQGWGYGVSAPAVVRYASVLYYPYYSSSKFLKLR